ncbi:MAG: chemotaxis protein CheB [Spirochaetota bacterium]
MPLKKIKIILVDDSPLIITILKKILSKSHTIEILGTASNGQEGFALAKKVNPDVVCTDLMMPVMDGYELTKKIMAEFPKPILIISTEVQKENETNIFNVLKAGAVDVFPKPLGNSTGGYEKIAEELILKIKVVSGVVVFSKKNWSGQITETKIPSLQTNLSVKPPKKYKILLLGASTGGPPALQKVLSGLGSKFPSPIICIQHISEGFTKGFIDWLNSNVEATVTIAQEGAYPKPGMIYFPNEKNHLGIDYQGKFVNIKTPPYKGHKPSVSVSFFSFFEYYRSSCLAVLLTGMGDDGADAMKTIKMGGGYTIAQSQASCVVFGMPKVAIEQGGVNKVIDLDKIPQHIKEKYQLPL